MITKLRGIAATIAAVVVLTSACSTGDDDGGSQNNNDSQDNSAPSSIEASSTDPTDAGSTEAGEGASATEADDSGTSACAAPDGDGQLLDQDMSDHQVPWERRGADRVAIYFEAADVSADYRGYMEQGANLWNRSPCLEVLIVDRCPEDANCVTVSLTPGDDADGNFASVENGDFTVGGHIDLYFEELDKLGDGAKLNVTIHEMGHAVGLRHRQTERVLMNGDTYTDVFDPDDTDYRNLLLLYGNQA